MAAYVLDTSAVVKSDRSRTRPPDSPRIAPGMLGTGDGADKA